MPTTELRNPSSAPGSANVLHVLPSTGIAPREADPLDDIVQSAAALIGVPSAFIGLMGTTDLTVVARCGMKDDRIPLTPERLLCLTPHGASSMIGDNPSLSGNSFAIPTMGNESFMAFPMVTSKGVVIGVLGLSDMEVRPFTAEQIRLLEFMARQATALIEEQRTSVIAMQRYKDSERALERIQKFQWLIEQSPAFHGMVDHRGGFYALNPAARKAIGLAPDSPLTFNLDRLVAPKDLDMFNEKIRPMMRQRKVFEHRLVLRRLDNEATPTTWFTIYPIRGLRRITVGYGLLIRDITAQEADDLRRDHLIREGVHRAGNLITVMSMIIDRTFVGNDDAQRRLKARARVQAIAAAQAILGTSSVANITDTVRRTLQGFDESGDRIRLSGPQAILSEKQTQGLSLALYELATNALKYGALSVVEGIVQVDWVVSEQEELTLTWRESGGPKVSPPSSSGFGSILLSKLIAGYFSGGSRHDFHPDGLSFSLRGELDRV